jgi:lipoteichoic acid synthase
MGKTIKTVHLLFYFIISLFFMETLLRIGTTGVFFSSGLLFSLIFSISIAIIFYSICSLFECKMSYILSSVLLCLSAVIFSSQLVYYKFFRTFYTLYSAGNGAQVFEFWKDILNNIFKSSIWIIVFLIPALINLAFGKKILYYKKANWNYGVLLLCCFIFSYLVSLAAVCLGGREQYSAYDLYFNNSNLIFSVDRLGLMTTMRLDLQRLAFGWSPSLEVSAPILPNSSSDIAVDDDLVKGAKDIFRNIYKEKVVEYNIMNIDFTQLISDEKNQVIKDMHKYFERVQPTEKNNYTGKYKGYNLIFITAESFSLMQFVRMLHQHYTKWFTRAIILQTFITLSGV